MNKTNLTVSLVFLFNVIIAQTSSIGWITQAGGNSDDIGNSIACDENYVYNTGIFTDTCLIGDTVLISHGSFDTYISKYDKEGNFIWVRQFGGSGSDRSIKITYHNGHVYTTGFFSDTVSIGNNTLYCHGVYDMFLIDFDTNGELNWIRQVGGSGRDQGYALTTDTYNNIYLSGIFQDTLSIDGMTLFSKGEYDIFIAKLDDTGNTKWINQAGGTGEDIGMSLSRDNSDNIYLTGSFEDTATFGDTTITSLGYQDIFIAKYNSSGGLEWLQKAGGDWGAHGASITTDDFGNFYVSGIFGGTAFFGNDSVVSNGWFDVYLAKFASSGKLQWINTYGSIERDFGYSVVTDNEYIYLSCFFHDETAIEDTILSGQTAHIFQFSNAGELLDMIQTGGYYRNKCTIDDKSALFVTGANSQSQVFGDTVISSTGFNSDAFITRINYEHTGLKEFEMQPPLIFYPNPARSYINIKHNEDATISIVNLNGQIMKQYVSDKNIGDKILDVSDLPPGIFIITLQTTEKILSGKLIKY
nr:T9SS type A sorting domain-containing protein [Bacteroidota bacterium]